MIIENKNNLNSMRRTMRFKSFIPLFIGVVIGFCLSFVFMPPPDLHCDIVKKSNIKPSSRQTLERNTKDKPSSTKLPQSDPEPVKPKDSHFNYDFRPYFVYSELGFHFQVIVAVITSEAQLLNYGVAINNTWLQNLPKVLFFTPYSKNANFHERFNTHLNLNVIQLPDILEDSLHIEITLRVLQYLKEHYINTYNWFMVIHDQAYVNTENTMRFLKSLNSSTDIFLGHPKEFQNLNPAISLPNGGVLNSYCDDKTGIILSRNILLKLDQFTVANLKTRDNPAILLAKTIFLSTGAECINDQSMQKLFYQRQQKDTFSAYNLKYKGELSNALVLYPVASSKQMLEIHRHFTLPLLQQAYDGIHQLQGNIKELQEKIPEDVPEKTLHWPVGFTAPFKPSSRFEVIQWTYFDNKNLYGYTDVEPVSNFSAANRKDVNDIMNIVKQAIQREYGHSNEYNFRLMNGYRRLDPQRGAEYIIDLEKSHRKRDISETKRVYLLRPFTKLEALPMPAATEQKGIHLVLPVLKEEISQYERFLQMYKRVCLQTGENVVLLTVFINIRVGQFEGEDKEDPFIESKNLIARYKHSYMWAQLPWLQVGVKNVSPVLVMDIVSMKLPSNALILIVSLSTDFTTNFMNRCRVNVVSGAQVFFPIPFAEYNPQLVYKTKQKPTFVEVHRNNGFWDRLDSTTACFNNKDYKDIRMLKDDFLDENQSAKRTLLDVFNESKLQVFRAVDAELRERYRATACSKNENVTFYRACTQNAGQRLGSRAQLAQLLFQNERFAS